MSNIPICNDFGNDKGCGQEILWVPNPEKPGKKMKANLDGTKHVHGSNIRTGMSGLEQAQANSNTERILNTVLPRLAELQEQTCNKVHDEVETVTSIFNRMNNDFIKFASNINENLKNIDSVLKIKKESGDIPNTIQQIDKDVRGLSDNFGRFAGALEALLIQKGFVSAGELYQKGDQAKIE